MLPTLPVFLKASVPADFIVVNYLWSAKRKNCVICPMFIQAVRDCLAGNLRLKKNLMT